MPLGLTPDEAFWVKRKWELIRKAQIAADKANNEWQVLNDAVNSWMDEMGILEPLQRAKTKEPNLALKDALAVGNWHSRNAERHIHDLQLFIKMKELELL